MKEQNNNVRVKIDKLNVKQIENLENYIDYHFNAEPIEDEIKDEKIKIYSIYKKQISVLIDKIEVYKHDFPISIYAGIETIFRCMASAALLDKSKAMPLYEHIKKYSLFFASELAIQLIELYIKVLKRYKRVIVKFNYAGVDHNFLKNFKKNMKAIKQKLKYGKRIISKKHKLISKYDSYGLYNIDSDFEKGSRALSESICLAEALIQDCEKDFPEIINNGYKNFFMSTGLSILSIVLTILFSAISAVEIYRLLSFFN